MANIKEKNVIRKPVDTAILEDTTQVETKNEIIREPIFKTNNFNLWYGDNHALQDINLTFNKNEISAIIGPSGCGKSTFVKALNRMVELVPIVRTEGEILYRDQNIFERKFTVEELRTKVGMVFQKPNPFPKSIYDNVAYGPRVHGIRKKQILDEVVEKKFA